MRHEFRSHRAAEGGFTLVEMLVAMTLTVLLMMTASQLMFSMKSSSDRMRMNSEARVRAQRALDYMAFQMRGAGDMNATQNNPAAIITWYQKNSSNVQATYNNVTNSSLADIGTDLITIARPNTNVQVPVITWPGFQHGANARWGFSALCPDGAANIAYFKELTGEHGGISDPILLIDGTGAFGFYQITGYLTHWNTTQGCSQSPPEIHVVANPGNSDMINPPGGQPTLNNPTMVLGVKFYSYRVRDGWLEQKEGMFDPATDNPGTAFIPLMPNIEDFQIAWIFDDGSVWDSSAQTLPSGTYTGSVPSQGTSNAYDVTNVRGFRLSIVARSLDALPATSPTTFARPAVEDHAAGSADKFYHERATSTVMIRNRNLRQ